MQTCTVEPRECRDLAIHTLHPINHPNESSRRAMLSLKQPSSDPIPTQSSQSSTHPCHTINHVLHQHNPVTKKNPNKFSTYPTLLSIQPCPLPNPFKSPSQSSEHPAPLLTFQPRASVHHPTPSLNLTRSGTNHTLSMGLIQPVHSLTSLCH